VGHGNRAVRRKVVSQLARVIGLEDVNGVRGHIGCHVAFPLICRLRRSMDVHHEVVDGASGAELDLGMSPAHAREAIHTIDDDRVSAASYALHGDRIATEPRDETIPVFRLARAACDGCQCGEEKRQASKRWSLQNHVGSFD
jgi:hypothetical protein